MNIEQELEVKELAFRLLKEKPYLAMEYLDSVSYTHLTLPTKRIV